MEETVPQCSACFPAKPVGKALPVAQPSPFEQLSPFVLLGPCLPSPFAQRSPFVKLGRFPTKAGLSSFASGPSSILCPPKFVHAKPGCLAVPVSHSKSSRPLQPSTVEHFDPEKHLPTPSLKLTRQHTSSSAKLHLRPIPAFCRQTCWPSS